MTPKQIAIVQETYDRVVAEPEKMGAVFYERLFALAPEIRPMFPEDMRDQSRKLVDTLGAMVHGLRHFDAYLPQLHALGERHHRYGVQPQHYVILREALLWAFAESLGSAFTDEVEEAWIEAYALFAGTMEAEAREPCLTGDEAAAG